MADSRLVDGYSHKKLAYYTYKKMVIATLPVASGSVVPSLDERPVFVEVAP